MPPSINRLFHPSIELQQRHHLKRVKILQFLLLTPLREDSTEIIRIFLCHKLFEIGVQQITVHAESAIHLDRTLGLIRDYGIKAGLALNPATSINTITYVLDRIDYILIMTVNPGFAGQSMVPSALQKIADCQEFLQQRGLPLPIEVDGNVSFENIPKMVGAGANILVAGSSSIFNRYGSRLENVERVREAISQGLQMRNQHGQ